MLDAIIVMGITVAVVELIKSYLPKKSKRRKLILPFIVLGTGAAVQVLNSGIFGPGWNAVAIKDAAKQGIQLAVFYAGIYSMGKKATQATDDVVTDTKAI